MENPLDYPLLVFAVSFVTLCLSVVMGAALRRKRALEEDTHRSYDVMLAATLTLLGLIIGFSFSMATCCCLLVGYGVRDRKAGRMLIPILPLVVSIAFFLIADIDSPRGGVIRVSPQNLISLVRSQAPH
jgi:hypothetical protein